MTQMVRDFIEVRECGSLDRLIDCLIAARDRVPRRGEAEVRLRSDDVMGHSISISFLRPPAAEEAGGDARSGDCYLQSLLEQLAALEDSLPSAYVRARA